jgi:hypothetical protein
MDSSTGFTTKTFTQSSLKAETSKSLYEQKLETSHGIDTYKYVLLINTAALEGYVVRARLQAQQSFVLSKVVAIIRFHNCGSCNYNKHLLYLARKYIL